MGLPAITSARVGTVRAPARIRAASISFGRAVNHAKWLFILVIAVTATAAWAGPVGEQHRAIPLASAAARRADRGLEMRVTVWYPAAPGAAEIEQTIGPPGRPFFVIGAVALDAAPAEGRAPVILLSHGFGGSATMMGWLGIALARAGHVVVAVDHPGNTDGDKTLVGAVAWWERPRDLIAALHAIEADGVLGPHLDPDRVGAAGFSMGGTTALALGGARIDPAHYDRYCALFPADGTCEPPPEQPDVPRGMTVAQGIAMLGLDGAASHAGEGTALPGLRAVVSIAPNAQALAPESLQAMRIPTVFIVGAADPVVPPSRHAAMAAGIVPGAKLIEVPGAEHYTFLATCTPAAVSVVSACASAPEQEAAHAAAVKAALMLFGTALRAR